MKTLQIMVRPSYILTLALCMTPSWVWAQSPVQQPAVPTEVSVGVVAEATSIPQVREFRLDNGMTVWVKPDHRSPTVTHMVWYRVGSRDEVDGTSGVAHVLEHMMFRGTPAVPNGDFSRQVAQAGGDDNAFTSYDMTAYFQQIPNQALPQMMRMEADRMRNLTLLEADFLKELEVVKEERRMRTDERPRSQLWERLRATTYMADPYHRPVIGWMSDLDAMTVADARAFYETWYRPDNAAVIIVGDVDPDEVFKLAQQTYGQIPVPSAAFLPSKPRIEPQQQGIRRIEHKAPASQSYVALVFKVPGLEIGAQGDEDANVNADAYALTLLAAVLDGTPSSRLQRYLVQGEAGKRIADSAGAGYEMSSRGPVLFMLVGVPAQGHTPEELEQALRAEIARIARDGVDAKELQRIKTQWVASQVFEKDSLMAQAQDLGSNWILNAPPQASDILLERLRQVTPEQVQSVAARYFGDDQLSVGILRAQPLPSGSADPDEGGAPGGVMH